jgi:hypothetical protein
MAGGGSIVTAMFWYDRITNDCKTMQQQYLLPGVLIWFRLVGLSGCFARLVRGVLLGFQTIVLEQIGIR